MEKAVKWLMGHDDQDLLLEEKGYSTWQYNVKKKGKALYPNVCYSHSLFCLSELFGALGTKNKEKEYKKPSEEVTKKLDKTFWNGEDYNDWIDEKIHKVFSTDGNVPAIMWNIADIEKGKRIENSLDRFGIKYVCSIPNQFPVLFWKRSIFIFTKASVMEDYHNGLYWL